MIHFVSTSDMYGLILTLKSRWLDIIPAAPDTAILIRLFHDFVFSSCVRIHDCISVSNFWSYVFCSYKKNRVVNFSKNTKFEVIMYRSEIICSTENTITFFIACFVRRNCRSNRCLYFTIITTQNQRTLHIKKNQ